MRGGRRRRTGPPLPPAASGRSRWRRRRGRRARCRWRRCRCSGLEGQGGRLLGVLQGTAHNGSEEGLPGLVIGQEAAHQQQLPAARVMQKTRPTPVTTTICSSGGPLEWPETVHHAQKRSCSPPCQYGWHARACEPQGGQERDGISASRSRSVRGGSLTLEGGLSVKLSVTSARALKCK